MEAKRKLLRIKFEGAELTELYLDSVFGFTVYFSEECEMYILCAIVKNSNYTLISGTFDECHTGLNKIHTVLKGSEDVVDINLN